MDTLRYQHCVNANVDVNVDVDVERRITRPNQPTTSIIVTSIITSTITITSIIIIIIITITILFIIKTVAMLHDILGKVQQLVLTGWPFALALVSMELGRQFHLPYIAIDDNAVLFVVSLVCNFVPPIMTWVKPKFTSAWAALPEKEVMIRGGLSTVLYFFGLAVFWQLVAEGYGTVYIISVVAVFVYFKVDKAYPEFRSDLKWVFWQMAIIAIIVAAIFIKNFGGGVSVPYEGQLKLPPLTTTITTPTTTSITTTTTTATTTIMTTSTTTSTTITTTFITAATIIIITAPATTNSSSPSVSFGTRTQLL
ncbi:hypothetical protein TWF506_005942 [Arthrobotrys conoides]|uniref:Uncharacterized protein n=1 Tax=Arthrobotrys conoides TaxID=74498 RepID=A0AAN8P7K6_9PEZI